MNSEAKSKSDAQGKYTIEKVSSGVYTIEFEKAHYNFPQLSNVQISPTNPNLPIVKVEAFEVCGKITINEALFPIKRSIKLQGNDVSLTTSTDSKGAFCFSVKPGEYEIQPIISESEIEKSLLFEPRSLSVTINNKPELDLQFRQIKVSISGSVECLHPPCDSFDVVLFSLNNLNDKKSVSLKNTNDFLFDEVYPGNYIIRVNQPNWCWDSNQLTLRVREFTLFYFIF